MRLLRAPERGGGEILVQARFELDIGGGELLARAHHLLIDPAERRAAIAGDIARRAQARGFVARLLHQHDAHQRLGAAEQDRPFRKVEPIAQ